VMVEGKKKIEETEDEKRKENGRRDEKEEK
jgi:hypothetical protein